jgi:hypothetical protein
VDGKLHLFIDEMNLNEIVTMVRCHNNCGKLFPLTPAFGRGRQKDLLQFVEPHIIARKKEMNVIDIGEICSIYFEGVTLNY